MKGKNYNKTCMQCAVINILTASVQISLAIKSTGVLDSIFFSYGNPNALNKTEENVAKKETITQPNTIGLCFFFILCFLLPFLYFPLCLIFTSTSDWSTRFDIFQLWDIRWSRKGGYVDDGVTTAVDSIEHVIKNNFGRTCSI